LARPLVYLHQIAYAEKLKSRHNPNTFIMKKVFLLVAVFLIGNTTQPFANNQKDVTINLGKKHRYDKSQEIRFVEEGVLYTIDTEGSFDFEVFRKRNQNKRGRKNNYVTYNNGNRKNVKYKRHFRPRVTYDRFGRVRSVNNTNITYQRNGKVKSIGCVPMKYFRGRLMIIGDMEIVYNRNGKIRDTYGYVNSYNRKLWHNNWYVYNDHDFRNDDVIAYGDRVRNKKQFFGWLVLNPLF